MRTRPLSTCMMFGLLCFAFALPGVLPAQESQPAETPSSAQAEQPTEWERLIYLPYKNLRQVFEKETATVFMPYRQFLQLWGKGRIADDGGDQRPVAAVISRADYRAKIVKDLANIEAKFTITVLGKPWAEVPLSFGDAAVGKMTASDDRILLRGTGEGKYALLLPSKGEHTVTLQLVSRVRTSPDGRSFALNCPAVGITNFELEIPAADQTVEVTPHLVSVPVNAEGNVTRVQASLGATEKIAARWHPRVSTAPEMDLLASVENTSSIRVADGLIHTHASLAYKILRGKLDQVRIAVPDGHRILDVSSPALKGWQTAKEQSGQVITVELLPGESRKLVIDVHTERAVPDGPFALAGVDPDGVNQGIHARGAVRESGLIAVSHASDITLPVETQTGLVRIESSEIPQGLRHPGGMFFKFYTREFDLQVIAKPVEPRVVAAHSTRFEFGDDELHVHTALQYHVERAGIFELRVALPPNFKVEDVHCDKMEKYEVADATRELVIALNGKTLGQIGVVITGNVDFQAGREETQLKLPLLAPDGVTRETGTVFVFAPEAIEIVTEEDGIIAAQPFRPQRIPPVRNMRLASAWTYTRRPVEITVTTLRKPTRLTASVGTTVNVKQELIEVSSLLQYDIQYAGIDTFVFAVPESVENVQIDRVDAGGGTAIKQRSRAEEAVDGWVTWTVVMQRDVSGKQRFRVKYDLPGDDEEGQTVLIEPLRVLEIPANEARGTAAVTPARVYGEISVSKDRALSVSAATETLEAIDVRELRLLPQTANLAYRYFKQPVDVSITAAKHEIQEVVETVVPRALIEAVISDDNSITYRCRYKITTSERQRLSIDLPETAELLGVSVAGKPGALERNQAAQPEKGWESYFVNVAREGSSDAPVHLMVLFRLEANSELLPQWGGSLQVGLPAIGGAEPAPVQQLRVVVWVPDEYSLVGSPERFTNDRRAVLHVAQQDIASTGNTAGLDRWIGGQSAGLFEFPTSGHAYSYTNLGGTGNIGVTYYLSSRFVLIISGALLLIAWLLSPTSWNNKLSVLIFGAFLLVLLSVPYPNYAVHALSVALPGLVVLLVIWLVHSLFRIRPQRDAPAESGTSPAAVAAVVPPPGVFGSWRSMFDKHSDNS